MDKKPLEVRILGQSRTVQGLAAKVEKSGKRMQYLQEQLAQKLAEIASEEIRQNELSVKLAEAKAAHAKLVASMDGVQEAVSSSGSAMSKEQAWKVLLGEDMPPPVQVSSLLADLRTKVLAASNAAKQAEEENKLKRQKVGEGNGEAQEEPPQL